MAGTISMGARREVLSVVAERYWSAGRVEKGYILDALCRTTGGIASTRSGRYGSASSQLRPEYGVSASAATARRSKTRSQHCGKRRIACPLGDDGIKTPADARKRHRLSRQWQLSSLVSRSHRRAGLIELPSGLAPHGSTPMRWVSAEVARTAPWLALKEANMDNTTLLIIILVVVILLGGGWYGRGRWF
jgi:hypothetical protein